MSNFERRITPLLGWLIAAASLLFIALVTLGIIR